MQNCKIRIDLHSLRHLDIISEQLKRIGVTPYGNATQIIRRTNGSDYNSDRNRECPLPCGVLIENNESIMIGTSLYFQRLNVPQIFASDLFMIADAPAFIPVQINNNIDNMNEEVILRCVKQPQKAKNLTVNEDYSGIYVDANDNQVDVAKDAAYFLCTNNAGNEARYKLELFAPIIKAKRAARPAPPPPPRPAPPPPVTLQELKRGLSFANNNTIFTRNNGAATVINSLGYTGLSSARIESSCGIVAINGIDNYMDSFTLNMLMDIMEDGISVDDVRRAVFESFIESYIANRSNTAAIFLFSTTELYEDTSGSVLEAIADYSSEWILNPNSQNYIKMWSIVTGNKRD
jgi:hypothetical protein